MINQLIDTFEILILLIFAIIFSMQKKVVKIVVFVPEAHADAVRKVMGEAGAGTVGDYKFCSFSVKGINRFIPL